MSSKEISLLKKYTNYDKIRDMSIDEMAILLAVIEQTFAKELIKEFLNETEFKDTCTDILNAIEEQNTHIFKFCKNWLESEAEK